MEIKTNTTSQSVNFFDIPDGVMTDPRKIKVIDGIAGAGKSSILHTWLMSHGYKNYIRLTSTRMLAADASERYDMQVSTIASGLFNTDHMQFYKNPKALEGETIVIDEILQTSYEVFSWCLQYYGHNNIFITCDSNQCLSPIKGDRMVSEFNSFINHSDVYYKKITQTLRGQDPDTIALFNRAYDMVHKSRSLYRDLIGIYPCINYADIEYNPYDVFVCYTNGDEKRLYDDYHLRDAYYLADLLMPKGTLQGTRRQYDNAERYPIIPQADAENATSYWQIRNIASVIRLQGTEIETDQKCYILVPDGMTMDNRSLYTAVTRCKSVKSICFIKTPATTTGELTRYNNKPVYIATWYCYPPDAKIGESYIRDLIDADGRCDPDIYQELVARIPRDGGQAYKTDVIIVGDQIVRPRYADADKADVKPIGIYNLFAREGVYEYNYLPELYRRYEEVQHAYGTIDASPYLISPTLRGLDAIGTDYDTAEDYYRLRPRDDYQYQFDIASAYPYILSHFPVICDGRMIVDETAPGLKLYVSFSDYFAPGAIVPDYLMHIIDVGNRHHHTHFEYLCTVPFSTSIRPGARLWDMSNRTKEDKEVVKLIKWGTLEKPYLQPWQCDADGNDLSYACAPGNNKQLIMLSIRAGLAYILLKLKDALLLDIEGGYTQADALFYNTDYTVKWQAELIERVCPGLHWRIIDNHDDEILYQNFADPFTRDDRRRMRARDNYQKRKLTKK